MAQQLVPVPMPCGFPSFTGSCSGVPTDPRRRSCDVSLALQPCETEEYGQHAPALCDSSASALTLSVMQQLPPSADWAKMQERMGDLRVAVTHAHNVAEDLRHQVAGLTASLQEKHAENAYLQSQFSQATDELQMLYARMHGQEQHAQSVVIARLQADMEASLQQRLELEAVVQQLQFELHAAAAHAASEVAAEREERSRCAAELGQVRMLLAARQRHLDCLQGQLDTAAAAAKDAADSHQQQLEAAEAAAQAANSAVSQAAAAASAAEQRVQELEQQLAQLEQQLEQKSQQAASQERQLVELQLQREWLEAAVTDLGNGQLDARSLVKMQEEVKRATSAAAAAEEDCRTWQQRALQAEQHLSEQQQQQQPAEPAEHLQQQLEEALVQLQQLQLEHQQLQAQQQWEAAAGRLEGGQGDTGVNVTPVGRFPMSRVPVSGGSGSSRSAWQEALGCSDTDDDAGGDTVRDTTASSPRRPAIPTLHLPADSSARAVFPGLSEPVACTQGGYSGQGARAGSGGVVVAEAGWQAGWGAAQVVDAEAQTELSAGEILSPGRSSAHAALLQAAQEEVAQLRAANSQLTQEVADSRKGMVCMSDVVSALEQARTLSRTKLEQALAASGKLWAERVADLTQKLQEAQDQVKELGDRLCETRRDQEATTQQLTTASQERDDAKESAQRLSAELAAAQRALEDAQSELVSVREEVERVRRQLQREHEAAVRQLRLDHESELAASLLDSAGSARQQLARLEQQLRQQAALAVEAEQQLQESNTQLQAAMEQLASQQQLLDEQAEAAAVTQAQLEAAQLQLQQLAACRDSQVQSGTQTDRLLSSDTATQTDLPEAVDICEQGSQTVESALAPLDEPLLLLPPAQLPVHQGCQTEAAAQPQVAQCWVQTETAAQPEVAQCAVQTEGPVLCDTEAEVVGWLQGGAAVHSNTLQMHGAGYPQVDMCSVGIQTLDAVDVTLDTAWDGPADAQAVNGQGHAVAGAATGWLDHLPGLPEQAWQPGTGSAALPNQAAPTAATADRQSRVDDTIVLYPMAPPKPRPAASQLQSATSQPRPAVAQLQQLQGLRHTLQRSLATSFSWSAEHAAPAAASRPPSAAGSRSAASSHSTAGGSSHSQPSQLADVTNTQAAHNRPTNTLRKATSLPYGPPTQLPNPTYVNLQSPPSPTGPPPNSNHHTTDENFFSPSVPARPKAVSRLNPSPTLGLPEPPPPEITNSPSLPTASPSCASVSQGHLTVQPLPSHPITWLAAGPQPPTSAHAAEAVLLQHSKQHGQYPGSAYDRGHALQGQSHSGHHGTDRHQDVRSRGWQQQQHQQQQQQSQPVEIMQPHGDAQEEHAHGEHRQRKDRPRHIRKGKGADEQQQHPETQQQAVGQTHGRQQQHQQALQQPQQQPQQHADMDTLVQDMIRSLSLSKLHVERSHAQEAAAARVAAAPVASQLLLPPPPATSQDEHGRRARMQVQAAQHTVVEAQPSRKRSAQEVALASLNVAGLQGSMQSRRSGSMPLSGLMEPLDILRASAGRDQARAVGLNEGRQQPVQQALAVTHGHSGTHKPRRSLGDAHADLQLSAAGSGQQRKHGSTGGDDASSQVVSISLQDLGRLGFLGPAPGRSRSVNRRYMSDSMHD